MISCVAVLLICSKYDKLYRAYSSIGRNSAVEPMHILIISITVEKLKPPAKETSTLCGSWLTVLHRFFSLGQ